ncbi:uncharacterized protein LOC113336687 [Papaver somniferum]|uniref:uncharacterized protein LOC113336687 n=1 Tax=Papaver somniferum TaxID=3469 RepID=UPI000E6FF25E|nr:uncharacterized protein LOC113336687 [Papaver somniferum]
MASSSCVLRLAAIHPCDYQYQTFRKLKPMLSPVHGNLTILSSPNPLLLITSQKHKLQFVSLETLQYPSNIFTSKSSSTICMATASLYEKSENYTPKIPATELCVLVSVYIIPFLNRLNLLSKFPVLKYAIVPLLGFYQSIPILGSIAFLSLFIGFVRYRNFYKVNYSLEAIVMDSLLVIASLARPFLVNPGPMAGGGALGFKVQLLNVLELLSFQTCIHSCLEYLGAVQWVGEGNALSHIMKVALTTEDDEGRHVGRSLVLKHLRRNDCDMNYAETCNKIIQSSCQSCLNSLLNLFRKARVDYLIHRHVDRGVDEQIYIQVFNLLWLLDILVHRQAAEEFAIMWTNQQELANLHKKFYSPHRHFVNFITTELLAGIRDGKILLAKDVRQLLLQTWFQPLVDDYSSLRSHGSFDQKVEENIERAILELTPEARQTEDRFGALRNLMIVLEMLVNVGQQTIIFIITLPRTFASKKEKPQSYL